MKYKSVEIIHIGFQQNLLKGVWNIWKRPLIASLEPGFIVDQYA
jgi:hypothetical protein